jgi:2-amino-4-hydroxy-6-hydroxymethyldihydropteridine diphosphokinase
MKKYHILLGGNMGNTAQYFKQTILMLQEIGTIEQSSSLYKTAPWGKKYQRYYLNQMVIFKSKYGPFRLLNTLKKIEKKFDRTGKGQMMPRKIDLDIIAYETHVIDSKSLTIPHPRMHLRNFVLLPLQEIDPNFTHSRLKISIKEMIKHCKDTGEVLVM